MSDPTYRDELFPRFDDNYELTEDDVTHLLRVAVYSTLLVIFALTFLLLTGCGGQGDDAATDSRTCITNINNNPVVNVEQAVAEAEEEPALDVVEVAEAVDDVPLVDPFPGQVTPTEPVSQVAICGTNTDVDAVVTNPLGREALAAFLVNGEVL